jgi:hypothetical protein
LPVTTIDVTGQYSGMGGPMATAKTSKPGYRLLGAIIENPGGNVFLKFTGRKDHRGERAELRANGGIVSEGIATRRVRGKPWVT